MIHDGWQWVRLGWIADTIVPQRDKPTELTGQIPWLRIEDFDGKYLLESKSGQGVTADQVASMPLRIFPKDTVICSCSCTMGASAIAGRDLVTNQTFIGLVPDQAAVLPDFLYYVMQGIQDRLQERASGAIQQYLSKDEFRNLRFLLPPLDEQRRIADFLDDQVARIDNVVAAREKQVELNISLSRRRIQSLFESSEAPMTRVGYLARVGSGTFLDAAQDSDDGRVPVIGGNGDTGRRTIVSNANAGDIAIGRVGALCGNVHLLQETSWVTDNALILRPRSVLSNYLAAALDSFGLNALASKTAQPLITGTQVKDIRVAVPDEIEQCRLVDIRRSIQDHSNGIVGLLSADVNCFGELKRSLITSAVTGEFDVSTADGSRVPV